MPRLIDWPTNLSVTSVELVSGPRVLGRTAERRDARTQVLRSIFGLWKYNYSFAIDSGRKSRLVETLVLELAAGSAVATPFEQPNQFNVSSINPLVDANATVPIDLAGAKDTRFIRISDSEWGHQLEAGVKIGIADGHFGLYHIMHVEAPGVYEVWPPLRKEIDTSDFATLHPIIAFQLDGEAPDLSVLHGPFLTQPFQLSLVEVPNEDVESLFQRRA